MTRRHSDKQAHVKKAVKEFKAGRLKIGNSNKKVETKKQAIAIGISQSHHKS